MTPASWFLQCLAGPSTVASGAEFSVFENLKIKCTQSLEPAQVQELIENVRAKEVNPQCRIDTRNIKTLRDAKVCTCARKLVLWAFAIRNGLRMRKSNAVSVCPGADHRPGVRNRPIPRRILPAAD
jgi:hypothetical protein